MRAGSVYRITCEANGRVYIGSTVRSPRQRWLEHLHYLRKGTHHSRHLQHVFNKYGEHGLRFEVIEHVEDAVFVPGREQFQLWRHAGRLMNAKDQVDPCVDFTPEVRAKMSEKRRAREDKPCSEETKAKISQANKGKRRTPEQIEQAKAARLAFIERERPIWLAMLREGKSYREIEKATGRTRKMIARECRGFV